MSKFSLNILYPALPLVFLSISKAENAWFVQAEETCRCSGNSLCVEAALQKLPSPPPHPTPIFEPIMICDGDQKSGVLDNVLPLQRNVAEGWKKQMVERITMWHEGQESNGIYTSRRLFLLKLLPPLYLPSYIMVLLRVEEVGRVTCQV